MKIAIYSSPIIVINSTTNVKPSLAILCNPRIISN